MTSVPPRAPPRRPPPPVPPRLAQPTPPTRRWVHASYYPSWRIYRGAKPSSLNIEVTTHLFYAFARVNADGTLYHLDEKADLQLQVDGSTGCLAACIALKQRNPNLKLILTIGGSSGSDTFPAVAASATTRETFAQSARTFIDKYGFDGIDIDWEHPKDTTQGTNYLLLLQTCRRTLPQPRYLLTSALPTGDWCLRNIDMASVSQTLDWINLMCYDFSGPWTEMSGHQSQLYTPANPHSAFGKRSCDAAVSYLATRGVPSNKIVLGIPAYGRSFLGTTGVGQKFTGHAGESGGIFEYKDLPRPGAREDVDWNVVAAYSVGGDGGFVSYDVPATVAAKAQFVKQMGLGGMFYWTGVGDAPAGSDRCLMSAGWAALHS